MTSARECSVLEVLEAPGISVEYVHTVQGGARTVAVAFQADTDYVRVVFHCFSSASCGSELSLRLERAIYQIMSKV